LAGTIERFLDAIFGHAYNSLEKGCVSVVKRTYQPKKRRRMRVHGFRHRSSTSDGRAILKRRRFKGRHQLTVWNLRLVLARRFFG